MTDTLIDTKHFPGGSFKFHYTPEIHASHWTMTDEDSVRAAYWHIKKGDVIVDAGCAYGSYSLFGLAMGAGQVHAWSPEHYREIFEKSIAENGWSDKTKFHELGLWSKAGWLEIQPPPQMPKYTEEKPESKDAFEVRTLDSYEFDQIDWLKLDVEGAEAEVLRGASETIKKHKPRIVIENHLFMNGSIANECDDVIRATGVEYEPRQEMPYHSVSHSLFVPKE